MFDPVPWVVEGGNVTDETARVFANIATRDSEGVALPGDFKVSPLSVPGSAVVIAPGGLVIRNRQAPGESYLGRAGSPTIVGIDSTGDSPRSDLILARVRDPNFAPWQPWPEGTPPDTILNGPYFEPFVVQGVPNTTTAAEQAVNYSAVALARIDIPKNTAAINGQMVTNLRELALPRFRSEKLSAQPGTALLPRSTVFQRWPDYMPTVVIPKWATWLSMSVTLSGMGCAGNVDGFLRAAVGDIIGGDYIVDVDTAASREVFVVTASGWISETDKGRTVQLVTEGRLYPSSPGTMGSNQGSHVLYDIDFHERTV